MNRVERLGEHRDEHVNQEDPNEQEESLQRSRGGDECHLVGGLQAVKVWVHSHYQLDEDQYVLCK